MDTDTTPARGDLPEGPSSPAERAFGLALRVLDLTRGLLVAEAPFLASSVGLLEAMPAKLEDPLATDGRVLQVDAARLLRDFSHTRRPPVHDLAHVLAHCLLLHPFVSPEVDGAAWDLACDVVAEGIARELLGPRDGVRGRELEAMREQLLEDLGANLTTERLYRALLDGAYRNVREQWAAAVHVDGHGPWPSSRERERTGLGESPVDAVTTASKPQAAGGPETSPDEGARDRRTPSDYRDGLAEATPADGAAQGDGLQMQTALRHPAGTAPQLTDRERGLAEEAWSRAAKSMRVDLETRSRERGSQLRGLVRELEQGTRERRDYRAFLRQFAVEREETRLSDDEFDYVFYIYGLALYHDMPLVEPLEYRSEKRVRDFVAVIDTSGSVAGEVVREFVDATFDVLSSEGGLFAKTNVHVIQADARVQSDVKITSAADLDRWRRSMRLEGFGGTDFRPAFAYVEELRQAGEFDDLQGLVYFTDGWGVYPEKAPPYRCAFVFYDEDNRGEQVPPWAVQLVLHPGDHGERPHRHDH